ncbi:MAG: acyl-CoA dehydrogenase family protein [Actinomycetes bacterium]
MSIQASEVGQLAAGAVADILDRATSGRSVADYAETTPIAWSVIAEGGWDRIGIPESADGGGASLRDLAEVALAWGQGCVALPFLESTWARRWSTAAREESGPISVSVKRSVPKAPSPQGENRGGLAPYGAFPGVVLARSIGQGDDVFEPAPDGVGDPFAPSLCSSLVPWTSQISPEATLELGVIWAAEAVGAAQHLLNLSVEYAKTREQFGKPIGSFQAVKHRLADMHSDVQYAETAVIWASLEPDNSRRATAYALDTAIEVAQSSIQVHGGMGFTWEMGLHFYLRTMLVRRQLVQGLWA